MLLEHHTVVFDVLNRDAGGEDGKETRPQPEADIQCNLEEEVGDVFAAGKQSLAPRG